MSDTANMGMSLPDPSVTTGPTWAQDLNDALDVVDQHDHSSGKGVKVPAAGLNINADLSFQSHNINAVRTVRLDSQSTTPSGSDDIRVVYSKDGELAYRDASGNEVILTSGGSVAGATGTITGLTSPASAAFNSVSGLFSFLKDSSKPGKVAVSDIKLYEYDNASAAAVTIASPASLGAAYTLTLPTAVPATVSQALFMKTTGAAALGTIQGTTNQITVSQSNETLTFSTPQDIATSSSPTFVGLTLSGSASIAGSATVTGTLTLTGGFANAVKFPVGTVSAPSVTFSGATTTGLWQSVNALNFAVGGALPAYVSSVGLRALAGSAGNPGYSFISDTGTGLYQPSSGQIGFATGSANLATISSSGLNIAGGGAFKAAVYSGTLTGSGSTTLTPGGTIVGAVGYTQISGGNGHAAIQDLNASGTNRIFFDTYNGTGSVALFNNYSGSNSYRVIVFYV